MKELLDLLSWLIAILFFLVFTISLKSGGFGGALIFLAMGAWMLPRVSEHLKLKYKKFYPHPAVKTAVILFMWILGGNLLPRSEVDLNNVDSGEGKIARERIYDDTTTTEVAVRVVNNSANNNSLNSNTLNSNTAGTTKAHPNADLVRHLVGELRKLQSQAGGMDSYRGTTDKEITNCQANFKHLQNRFSQLQSATKKLPLQFLNFKSSLNDLETCLNCNAGFAMDGCNRFRNEFPDIIKELRRKISGAE